MWWTTIIVVALLAFGIVGFVSMVRLFEQRLTSETTRRAEDMYDQYADSPRERHRRSLTSRRYWPVLPNRVPDSPLRFAARSWRLAFGLALAVRPAGLALGLRGQRRAAGASRAAGCEVPLRPEGQTAGHWGCQARQSPRRRACVRRTRRKLPPHNGETLRVNPSLLRRVTPGRSFHLGCPRPSSLFTAGAARPGAPKVRP